MTSKPNAPAPDTSEHDSDEAREANRLRARRAIARQPARTVTILSSLLAAQDELGWLPSEAIAEVAGRNSATANTVWGIASFYPNFRFTEPNRHKVELCWGPTCHVLGAQAVLRGLLPHLGLAAEGETDDGVISLKLNTCLGVCAHAPAMSFDDELSGHMDLELAIRLVEGLKAEDEEAKAIRDAAEASPGAEAVPDHAESESADAEGPAPGADETTVIPVEPNDD